MAIDGCQRKLIELTLHEMPRNLRLLREAEPKSMDSFCVQGREFASLRFELGKLADFSGCYVLFDGSVPIYVGISRKVIARLRQHVFRITMPA
jgi:hypothetical protein